MSIGAQQFTATNAFASIPADMREVDAWVGWEWAFIDGLWTKPPYNLYGLASTTNPKAWLSFDRAAPLAAKYDGIGFVFHPSHPYAAIDLDGCVSEAGAIDEWAQAIIERVDSYAELSPTKRGIRVIVRLTDKRGRTKTEGASRGKVSVTLPDGTVVEKTVKLELFVGSNYTTITGDVLPGCPDSVEDRQAEFDALWSQCEAEQEARRPKRPQGQSAGPTVAMDDDEILGKCATAKNAAKFRRLFDDGNAADYGQDASSADSALACVLAFYTRDAGQIERLMRRSKLVRDKWDRRENGDGYLRRTIGNALDTVTACYKPRPSRPTLARAAKPAVKAPVEIAPPDSNQQPPEAADMPGGDDAGNDDAEEQPRMTALGERDADGNLFLSTKSTLPSAVAMVREHFTHPLGRTLHVHAGSAWAWEGNRYVEADDALLRAIAQPWAHQAWTYAKNRHGEIEAARFPANHASLTSIVEATKTHVHLTTKTAPPFWIGGETSIDPREIIPCKTFNYRIDTGTRLPATPKLFNLSALDFDPVPNPPKPMQWLAFLNQLWPNDPQQPATLAEFMGYTLALDTRQQKALLMVGPRRSGKGTIVRTWTRLVGAANCVGLTTSGLAGLFGMQPLIGKSLATIPDCRFQGEGVATVTERLLAIIGEDGLTVDVKHRPSVTTTLGVGFVLLANELPRFSDASAALVGRFIILKLTESFYGKEDPSLSKKLETELPGIFAWAVDGLKRLRARGHFLQPAAGAELVHEMEDLASPVSAFVRETCEVGPDLRAYCDDLYPKYRQWCIERGHAVPPTSPIFSRDLSSAFPHVRTRQNTVGRRFFAGLGIAGGC